ncbi:MAG: hypothetical protein HQL11_05350, partial [Candidatus Omnitrophica bacterium]|nr:hypothetical protein [Candidatus Omnitrophota bacterium]
MDRLKATAVLLVLAFFCQEIAQAAPLPPSAGPGVSAAITQEALLDSVLRNPMLLEIPGGSVMLREVHPGTNGRLIVHIQDAHANYGAQKALAEGIEFWAEKYGIRLVLAEGSSADVSLSPMKARHPEIDWPRVAGRFLFDGVISGEEYLSLAGDEPLEILGIEDRDLYDRDLVAYADLAQRREACLAQVRRWKNVLERIKARRYPKSLRDYEAHPADDQITRMEALTALASASGVGVAAYPQIQSFLGLREIERRIDFGAASQELTRLIERLELEEETKDLRQRTRSGDHDAWRILTRNVLAKAERAGVALQAYPNVRKATAYLDAYYRLDMPELLNEVGRLEKLVYEKLLGEESLRTLRAVDRYVGLLEKAYEIRLSSEEYAELRGTSRRMMDDAWQAFVNGQLFELDYIEDLVLHRNALDVARVDLKRFYALVRRRDAAFVRNASRRMGERGAKAAILIAGGYHTPNLERLWRREGTGYVVVAPVVKDETDHETYEELLLAPVGERGSVLPRRVLDAEDYLRQYGTLEPPVAGAREGDFPGRWRFDKKYGTSGRVTAASDVREAIRALFESVPAPATTGPASQVSAPQVPTLQFAGARISFNRIRNLWKTAAPSLGALMTSVGSLGVTGLWQKMWRHLSSGRELKRYQKRIFALRNVDAMAAQLQVDILRTDPDLRLRAVRSFGVFLRRYFVDGPPDQVLPVRAETIIELRLIPILLSSGRGIRKIQDAVLEILPEIDACKRTDWMRVLRRLHSGDIEGVLNLEHPPFLGVHQFMESTHPLIFRNAVRAYLQDDKVWENPSGRHPRQVLRQSLMKAYFEDTLKGERDFILKTLIANTGLKGSMLYFALTDKWDHLLAPKGLDIRARHALEIAQEMERIPRARELAEKILDFMLENEIKKPAPDVAFLKTILRSDAQPRERRFRAACRVLETAETASAQRPALEDYFVPEFNESEY